MSRTVQSLKIFCKYRPLGDILSHCWKEHLKIRKPTKFKGDTSKVSEGITPHSPAKFYKHQYVGGTNLPLTIKLLHNSMTLQSCIPSQSLVFNESLSNLTALLILSFLFSRVDELSLTVPSQKLKMNRGRVDNEAAGA